MSGKLIINQKSQPDTTPDRISTLSSVDPKWYKKLGYFDDQTFGYQGEEFNSLTQAYVYHSVPEDEREEISDLTNSELAERVEYNLAGDLMYKIIIAKFEEHKLYKNILTNTGSEDLVFKYNSSNMKPMVEMMSYRDDLMYIGSNSINILKEKRGFSYPERYSSKDKLEDYSPAKPKRKNQP